jgi:predicted N-acyltransferase
VKLDVEIITRLDDVDATQWNRLGEAGYPFIRHEFLNALEQHHCLHEFGWQPVHFLLRDQGELVAACPCYIKSNAYGELVFDHSWAQAYESSGEHYYPKLVTAIPYTPASGPRLLTLTGLDESRRLDLRAQLVRIIQQFCQQQKLSGWHILFEREPVLKNLSAQNLMLRYDCQFHWHNRDYQNFDDFLSHLSSRKRKNIRRERASVAQENLLIEQKFGDELSADEWAKIHQLYAGIFDRKYGTATLTANFFQAIGASLKKQVMVVLASNESAIIAASLFFISDDTLYGRIWGCDEYYNQLHFECCYYQGIDFCIAQGLQHFDPGAQGEHKISRGFLPTRTCSAHWFVDQNFHSMIENYLQHEEQHIDDYCRELALRSPYKKTGEAA